jgi:hypothetical protein
MIALVEQPFNCVHCGKNFMKEKTLVAHMCERKRRALQRDEKRVQAGFMAYNRFWQLTQNSKKTKSYDDFADSSYYNAFVKFGSFINNVNPLYPDKFVDWIIKSGAKLDNWCKDQLYEQYLYETLKTEPVESAVQRTLQTMMEWADDMSANFVHYFMYVSLNRAVHDVRNGRISAWMILNTKSGHKMINNMSDEQLDMIAPAFDVAHWQRKFKESPADVALVKEICKEVGIE